MGMSELTSQKMRKLAPELDPLRIGTGWRPEDLAKPQVFISSTFGDSHPGSGHLDILVEEVKKRLRRAATAPVISARICVTVRARGRTGLTIAWSAGR